MHLPGLLVLGGLVGCAGGPSVDSGTDTSIVCEPEAMRRMQNGVATSGFEAVVSVNEVASSFCARTGVTACTGTVIGPRRVLTAAHCLGTVPDEALGVVFGSQSLYGSGPVGHGLDGIWFQPSEVTPHPEYDAETGANDLMLLGFDVDLPATPIAFATLDSTFVGTSATVVGFGGAADGEAFVKQEGTVRVESMDTESLRYVPDPSMSCAGDSGGPVLFGGDGDWLLAAVTVRGDAECEEYGQALRLDAFLDFIE